MITQGDDYPIHQTPEPVQQVFTSDRNFYDRFFFNGYFREGEPYFAVAMGIYPNVGIIDCAFSVDRRRRATLRARVASARRRADGHASRPDLNRDRTPDEINAPSSRS